MIPIVISHSIFLTKIELNNLSNEKTTIETVGISVPVVSGNYEKQTEVFCRYILTNEITGPEVEIMEDGYKLYITDKIKELYYEVETPISLNEKRLLALHQISIHDTNYLEQSTVCEKLEEYINKS